MRLMDTDRAIGEVVNIGNTEEISISELAQTVKARTQSKSDITYVPYDQAYEPGFEDMMRRGAKWGEKKRKKEVWVHTKKGAKVFNNYIFLLYIQAQQIASPAFLVRRSGPPRPS